MAAEERERARRYELGTQGIEIIETEVHETTDRTDAFRLVSAMKFVPPFYGDVEQFFESFEKTMELHKFSRDKWSKLMDTKLMGKAQRAFQSCLLKNAMTMTL